MRCRPVWPEKGCISLDKETAWKTAKAAQKVMCSLPYGMAVRLGGVLGILLWACSKKKVDGAERRCVRALSVGVTEARRIVRRSYANLGRSVAEFVSVGKARSLLPSIVEIHGEEHLAKAFEKGKGVIFLSAHLGNWELGAAAVAARGYPMNAIGADQRDDRITDLIMANRSEFGVKTVSKGFDLKAAIRCLQRGEVLAILIDQDVREKGVVVPFLGLPASTPYGPVKIAQRTRSVLLPVFMVRRGSSLRHDLHFLPSPWKDGYPEEGTDMESAMTVCNDHVSRWIRSSPEQWMWLYPRWSSTEGHGE